jgi:hypothetical protein
MTLKIIPLNIMADHCFDEFFYVECYYAVVMHNDTQLNVIMLSVLAPIITLKAKDTLVNK